MPARSLTTRFLLTLLLSTAVPLLGFMFWAQAGMRERLTRVVVGAMLPQHAEAMAAQIRSKLRELRQSCGLLVSTREAEHALGGAAQEFEDQAAKLQGFHEDFQLVLVADTAGRIVAKKLASAFEREAFGDRLPVDDLATVATQPWFVDMARNELTAEVWVDRHRSPLVHRTPARTSQNPPDYALGLALRIDRGGGTTGVFYALLSWSRMQAIVDAGQQRLRGDGHGTAEVALVDAAGQVLAHGDRGQYGRTLAPAAARGLLSAAAAVPELPPGWNWNIAVEGAPADLLAAADALQRELLLAVGAVIVIVLAWSLFAARTIVRPVRTLRDATLQVARGELDVSVPERGGEELAALARTFNQMARDLADGRKQLAKAEREAAWAEMARQVAHEIKNPLTPMRMSAQTYLRKKSDESAERLARTVVEQTDTLARIANDFRHFAAPTGPSKQRLAGDELLAAAEQLFAGEAAERSLTLLVEPGAAGTRIEVDRQDLQRVVTNLLRNAFEACGPGGRIELRSERDADRFVLRVIDDGPGVTTEARARLFEPNFTTKSAGTGLGLALCKRIVESWQGTIELESSVPGRTVFRVGIPVVAAECR